ncbi:MAG: 50S ribosomal protein L3 [Planctomycetaceae bacterium]|jgi:large subunit ribosomal protein L3|nr:50S ribosomal protein L3 [Planctomycetaceae bacterium]
MSIGLLGQKVGMTQLYTENGEVIPVTVIQAGPCPVLQIKNLEKDGYEAVQIGYGEKKRSRASRSERGHVAKLDSKAQKAKAAVNAVASPKADCEPVKLIREFRVPPESYNVGQVLTVGVFQDVLSVDVTAVSKGRGYAGAMKRHNFSGQRASHGVKKCHRHLGSTGCSAYPSRTMKGKKMPGQYGNAQVTVRNQKVVSIDTENNLLVIRGAIPGPNGVSVLIAPTNKLPAPKINKWRVEKKQEQEKNEATE